MLLCSDDGQLDAALHPYGPGTWAGRDSAERRNPMTAEHRDWGISKQTHVTSAAQYPGAAIL